MESFHIGTLHIDGHSLAILVVAVHEHHDNAIAIFALVCTCKDFLFGVCCSAHADSTRADKARKLAHHVTALRNLADFILRNLEFVAKVLFHNQAIAATDVPPGVLIEIAYDHGAVDFVSHIHGVHGIALVGVRLVTRIRNRAPVVTASLAFGIVFRHPAFDFFLVSKAVLEEVVPSPSVTRVKMRAENVPVLEGIGIVQDLVVEVLVITEGFRRNHLRAILAHLVGITLGEVVDFVGTPASPFTAPVRFVTDGDSVQGNALVLHVIVKAIQVVHILLVIRRSHVLVRPCVRRCPRSRIKDKVIAGVLFGILCSLNFLVEVIGIGVNRNTERVEADCAIARTKSNLRIGFGKASTALPLVMHHAAKPADNLVFFGHVNVDRRGKSRYSKNQTVSGCLQDFTHALHSKSPKKVIPYFFVI